MTGTKAKIFALLPSKTMNAGTVGPAGIETQKTYNMANTKTQKTIQTNNQIEAIHNEWCVDNGYPVKWTRLQAGRPKLQAPSERRSNGIQTSKLLQEVKTEA